MPRLSKVEYVNNLKKSIEIFQSQNAVVLDDIDSLCNLAVDDALEAIDNIDVPQGVINSIAFYKAMIRSNVEVLNADYYEGILKNLRIYPIISYMTPTQNKEHFGISGKDTLKQKHGGIN